MSPSPSPSPSPFPHHTYTPAQLSAYFTRISLSAPYLLLFSETPSPIGTSPHALSFLTALQRHHITSIPFENLDLHYSFHHAAPVTPEDVFEKIVARGAGRGGWCLQMNCLFGTVLRSLGYEMYATAARVSTAVNTINVGGPKAEARYNNVNHMISIVKVDGQRYLLDVGFGTGGPTGPIPLIPNYTAPNVPPQRMRLLHQPIPDFANQALLMWCYQYCNDPSAAEPVWTPAYCFSETEFLPQDFQVINHFITTHPSSSWLRVVMAMRRVWDEPGEEVVGEVTLVGREVKRRVGGRTEVLARFEGEGERVAGLERFLGIRLTEAERRGIRGLQTALS